MLRFIGSDTARKDGSPLHEQICSKLCRGVRTLSRAVLYVDIMPGSSWMVSLQTRWAQSDP